MKEVDLYTIISTKQENSICRLTNNYFLTRKGNNLIELCYSFIDCDTPVYKLLLLETEYNKIIEEIKECVDIIECWKTRAIKSSIDYMAEKALGPKSCCLA